MKDSHLTIRIPRELAQTLARMARVRGVSRSHLAREAVARYVGRAPNDAPATPAKTISAKELGQLWSSLPRLNPDEADDLERDIAQARSAIGQPAEPWH
ncbi:MAG TPA: CopG family transcriptional regulator [Gemmatimonadales bacterium]|nr:CopG family transcriptional regulator [Gemmatimonadales bacterium]